MSLESLATWALVVVTILGGGWGVITGLTSRIRKSGEAEKKLMWDELKEMRNDLNKAQLDMATLKEQVRLTPDAHELVGDLEEKLDRKLENLALKIQEAFGQATLKFRCPHDLGSN